MIDTANEELLTLTEATRRVATRPHASTIWRWAQRGCQGVRLEIIKIGGRTCTSTEALGRFFSRLTHGGNTSSMQLTSRQQARRMGQAERELAADGI